jgi:ribosome-associated translation inhibitor RaiA
MNTMLRIQSRGFALTPALKQRVSKRIGMILGNTAHPITSVDVRLSDINGPKGGVDKKCQIHIQLSGHPSVVITDIQHDLYYAIDRAASRAMRTVRRRLSQKQLNRNRRVRDAFTASAWMNLHGHNEQF